MASGVNKVILIGHVGRIESKNSITNASLATSETYKDKQTGEKKKKTSWHRLVFFGKLAEIANRYVKKGDKLYVEGAINYGDYVDKNNITRHTTNIVVRNMQMLSSPKEQSAAANGNYASYDQKPHGKSAYRDGGDDDFTDDIPF